MAHHSLALLRNTLAGHDAASDAWHLFDPALEDEGETLVFTTPSGRRTRLCAEDVFDLAFQAWTEHDGGVDHTYPSSGFRLSFTGGRLEIECRLEVPLRGALWYRAAGVMVSSAPEAAGPLRC